MNQMKKIGLFFFFPFSKYYQDKNFPPCADWEGQLQCGPVSSTAEQHSEWDMLFSYIIANNFCVFVQNALVDIYTQCPS